MPPWLPQHTLRCKCKYGLPYNEPPAGLDSGGISVHHQEAPINRRSARWPSIRTLRRKVNFTTSKNTAIRHERFTRIPGRMT